MKLKTQSAALLARVFAALAACAAAMCGCVSDRCTGMSAPTPKGAQIQPSSPEPVNTRESAPPPAPVVASAAALQIQFIPETSPYPGFGSGAPALSAAEQQQFDKAWKQAVSATEAAVTLEKLVEISRWAKPQTAGAKLDHGWAIAMPMHPIAASDDGKRVLLGQSAQESNVTLPSHSPIVFRRLLTAAEFDRNSTSITRVFVTIRGWAEE